MGVSRSTPEDVERLTVFLLARPPDLVLTPWPEDTHPDHVANVWRVIEAL
jgi:LmbE family N-acetylglucosaminyl deacetylase